MITFFHSFTCEDYAVRENTYKAWMERIRRFYRLRIESRKGAYPSSTCLMVPAISLLGRAFMANAGMPAALALAARFCYRSSFFLYASMPSWTAFVTSSFFSATRPFPCSKAEVTVSLTCL